MECSLPGGVSAESSSAAEEIHFRCLQGPTSHSRQNQTADSTKENNRGYQSPANGYGRRRQSQVASYLDARIVAGKHRGKGLIPSSIFGDKWCTQTIILSISCNGADYVPESSTVIPPTGGSKGTHVECHKGDIVCSVLYV